MSNTRMKSHTTFGESIKIAVLIVALVAVTPLASIYSAPQNVNGEGNSAVAAGVKGEFAKGKEKVDVIVVLNTSYGRYYNPGDSNSSVSSKKAEFTSIKDEVVSDLAADAENVKELKIVNGFAAQINANALEKLSKNPKVAQVALDAEATTVLNESLYEMYVQPVWAMKDAQNLPVTGSGITIAIIDSGVDHTHPDLGGCFGAGCKVVGGYDFTNSDSNPMDDNGHGTHVAATAAGKGTLNGVAPDAQILAYKVLNSKGAGLFSTIIMGIERAVDPNNDGDTSDHADVANLSLSAQGIDPDHPSSLAVDNASAAGVVVAVAAGNFGQGTGTIGTPGVARTAITVVAACKSSQDGSVTSYCSNTPIATFSAQGPIVWNGVDLQKPDVAAPGVLICAAKAGSVTGSQTDCIDSAHRKISGTSMATPHVAGAAALILQKNPSMTPAQVKNLMKDTARDLGVSYNIQGAGMVNVLDALGGVLPPDSTPPTVQMVKPLDGAKVRRGSGVLLEATASDNFGISKVEFYVSGRLEWTDTTASYKTFHRVINSPNKVVPIYAKAYDLSGNVTTSNTVTVTTTR